MNEMIHRVQYEKHQNLLAAHMRGNDYNRKKIKCRGDEKKMYNVFDKNKKVEGPKTKVTRRHKTDF